MVVITQDYYIFEFGSQKKQMVESYLYIYTGEMWLLYYHYNVTIVLSLQMYNEITTMITMD